MLATLGSSSFQRVGVCIVFAQTELFALMVSVHLFITKNVKHSALTMQFSFHCKQKAKLNYDGRDILKPIECENGFETVTFADDLENYFNYCERFIFHLWFTYTHFKFEQMNNNLYFYPGFSSCLFNRTNCINT